MAVSGFEGFEKRLELNFFGDDPVTEMGLRLINMESLEKVLNAVQCTVVSSVGNQFFDAYVLSESSLFIYPTKIIIKTCGTTQLLKSICPLIHYAFNLGLTLCSCRYTRGSFIFPKAQPFPHSSFDEEVIHLEETIPSNLCFRKASVMLSKMSNHSWHVFTASDQEIPVDETLYTIEVCMTELDGVLARKFFRRPGDDKNSDSAGMEMTEITGIDNIIPGAIICDFGFDPCGYSMNGIHDGDRYSTIHVTPEDGFSYASFECVGSIYDDKELFSETLKKAVQVFRPATLSVSTTCSSHEVWTRVSNEIEPLGFKCRSFAVDEFPSAGSVVFQTFTSRRK
ncbi:S-adenosylmethionine decarboxylase proenzyme 4-like [Tripterygium wilfordii]|uniref:S-adenosylmethionine decarboxylase proenzyme n=1 Tax=Tripterygium wilfordii TaxID=458696 RepID=A0A7J7CS18_TRIWF|nr:S-adenosylmethionine decarboxylase proenzyme 4 [Tripterygium wilfordii]KAF5736895.1 S-adenosylmethionine decarboxylase proenzyme 4-like [Tripterygium wilfordii]